MWNTENCTTVPLVMNCYELNTMWWQCNCTFCTAESCFITQSCVQLFLSMKAPISLVSLCAAKSLVLIQIIEDRFFCLSLGVSSLTRSKVVKAGRWDQFKPVWKRQRPFTRHSGYYHLLPSCQSFLWISILKVKLLSFYSTGVFIFPRKNTEILIYIMWCAALLSL